MNRRARHIHIIDNFGGLESRSGCRTVKFEFDRLLSVHGLDLLTDEAVEMLASRVVASYRFSQKLNRENRARKAARVITGIFTKGG
jgi:hypothetical protein